MIRRVGTSHMLMIALHDGRVVGLPLSLFPLLVAATPSERREIEIVANGSGLRWPRLDVDLSADGLLAGRPDFTSNAASKARELRLDAYFRSLGAFAARRAG